MFGVRFGMTIEEAKLFFRAGSELDRAVESATYRNLSRFGAYVRSDARHAFRRRKSSAKPGKGPTNWTGLIKDHIYFVVSRPPESVIVGPVKLPHMPMPGGYTVPELLENGGTVQVEVTRALLGRLFRARRYNRDAADVFRALRPKVGQTVSMEYEPRPYMAPAFEKNLGELPAIWRDSIAA